MAFETFRSTTPDAGASSEAESAAVVERVRFLGVTFAPLPLEAALQRIASRRADEPFGYVVTPNVDHLVRLARSDDPELDQIYDGAWLSLNDSRVLGALARSADLGLGLAPGADLVAALFEGVVRSGDAVTIIGGTAAAAETLAARYPLVRFAHHAPPMGLDADPEAMAAAVRFCIAHPAKFTLFAVGSPRQERLAAMVQASGRARGLGLCVGASVDFLTGRERRAPAWLRRAGLEWAFRLAQNPAARWRRYLWDGPRVFAIYARARLAGRIADRPMRRRQPRSP